MILVCQLAAFGGAFFAIAVIGPLAPCDDAERLGVVMDTEAGHAAPPLAAFNRTGASVVIAGAWRHPPAVVGARGKLARAFTLRLERGVDVAVRLGIDHVVLTGGRNDSQDARRVLLTRYGGAAAADIPSDRAAGPVLASLTVALDNGTVATRNVTIHIETKSTTTHTNAVEAAKVLAAANLSGPVVVVSSPYHLRRCAIFFRKAFRNATTGVLHRPVYTVGSDPDEFELVLPPLWWYSMQRQRAQPSSSRTAAAAGNKTGGNVTRNTSTTAVNATEGGRANATATNQTANTSADVDLTDKRAPAPAAATPEDEPLSYTVKVHPLANLFPDAVVSWAHSAAVTYRHYMSHARATAMSLPFVGGTREVLATVHNVLYGRMDVWDALEVAGGAPLNDSIAVVGAATPDAKEAPTDDEL